MIAQTIPLAVDYVGEGAHEHRIAAHLNPTPIGVEVNVT